MYSGSTSDPLGPWGKAKPSYVHYDIRWSKTALLILKLILLFHILPSVGSNQFCTMAHLGSTGALNTSYLFIKQKEQRKDIFVSFRYTINFEN